MGNPAKTYPQDGGEEWEYLSEHQRLIVDFYDKGVVKSSSLGLNPEFEQKTNALWRLLGCPDSNTASKVSTP